MSPLTYLAIYFICWWVVLFPVLSLGARSHSEAGLDLKDGGDPGAPVLPNLKRKFITTTWVALIPFAVVIVILLSGVADGFLGVTR
jgi:predicted secreted protein